MRRAWASLGLRGRLALSIAAIVIAAFAFVFVAVRAEMAHESSVIKREESREQSEPGAPAEAGEGSGISPIEDAQSDAEKALLLAGGAALVAALLAGYLLAARTASPLRRFATTAAEVDAGDLTPRLDSRPADAEELRTLAEAFNHMLDRLDRAFAQQRRFVSDASHELRSPLTAIRGQLEVLARNDSPSAEDVRRVEAMTMKEMGRVERLVDDLLALARLDEGAGLELREVQVAVFLGDLTAAEANETTEAGELCGGTVRIDPDLLAQVIRNLLSNAHRHAGPGGRVALSARAQGQAGGERLIVTVDDDGPGIPLAERERVFDRFYRSEAARDRASGGSGLGLGIARSILARHGGRIWIDDSPLGGARVSIALPGFKPTMRDLSPNA
jgi:two-component system, OmpR family, sensor kinase